MRLRFRRRSGSAITPWPIPELWVRRQINKITHRHPEPYAQVYRETVWPSSGTVYTRCYFVGSEKF